MIFVHNPYVAGYDEQIAANSVADIAKEYGIPYVNFVQINTIIDMRTDMYNTGHVNASGMKKLTDYMGKYLTTHKGVADHRQDPLYNNWKEDYEKFVINKREVLVNRPDIYSYLMLLHDKTYSCYIYIKEDSHIYEDEEAMNLLQNIGKPHIFEDTETTLSSDKIVPLSSLDICAESKNPYLAIIDNAADEIFENYDNYISGDFGKAAFNFRDVNNPELYIGDSPLNYLEDIESKLYDIQIVVFDASSNEIVDISKWGGTDNSYTERSNQ